MKKRHITLLIFTFSIASFSAQLTLPTIFSDHMVLQQEQPVPVWGKADPGETVTVEFAGQKTSALADIAGKWRVDLEPLNVSTKPQVLTVYVEGQTITFQDVLVGEVWLCSGQSNMERSLSSSENAADAVASAQNPLVRLYRTPQRAINESDEPVAAVWSRCDPGSARLFSAVAYYFGQKLQLDLKIPVGLIQSTWSGTRIEPWIPPCGFDGIPSLVNIRRQINPMPALGGNPRQDRQFPTALYNGMIAPHIPYAIRGAIWYQGESNRSDGMLYVDKTKALLNGWRKLWGYEFPFYFVQIAPYQCGSEDPGVLPAFWEAQTEIVKQIPKTGMAVISDCATLDNIHPPDKKDPGIRLALLAEASTYGMNVVSTGPVFQTLEEQAGKLKVVFSSADGLTTRDGKTPDWFEVSGKDGVFKPASAEIQGNSIILSSPDVPKPLAMRFAWNKLAIPNIMNGSGLPATAFRADVRSR